ncbi:hypothetical protein VO56_02100 [Mycoplasmopsis gallinacea]|uniref:Uncharacterized protein n=1 Tax=Mycoplasmopsis gallinacea TaxID=29556 RepID=A0A0D5ZJY5_9BACT|nr:hypothetical protein VO56_02100 [Mycoplasmopsis gallinacea]
MKLKWNLLLSSATILTAVSTFSVVSCNDTKKVENKDSKNKGETTTGTTTPAKPVEEPKTSTKTVVTQEMLNSILENNLVISLNPEAASKTPFGAKATDLVVSLQVKDSNPSVKQEHLDLVSVNVTTSVLGDELLKLEQDLTRLDQYRELEVLYKDGKKQFNIEISTPNESGDANLVASKKIEQSGYLNKTQVDEILTESLANSYISVFNESKVKLVVPRSGKIFDKINNAFYDTTNAFTLTEKPGMRGKVHVNVESKPLEGKLTYTKMAFIEPESVLFYNKKADKSIEVGGFQKLVLTGFVLGSKFDSASHPKLDKVPLTEAIQVNLASAFGEKEKSEISPEEFTPEILKQVTVLPSSITVRGVEIPLGVNFVERYQVAFEVLNADKKAGVVSYKVLLNKPTDENALYLNSLGETTTEYPEDPKTKGFNGYVVVVVKGLKKEVAPVVEPEQPDPTGEKRTDTTGTPEGSGSSEGTNVDSEAPAEGEGQPESGQPKETVETTPFTGKITLVDGMTVEKLLAINDALKTKYVQDEKNENIVTFELQLYASLAVKPKGSGTDSSRDVLKVKEEAKDLMVLSGSKKKKNIIGTASFDKQTGVLSFVIQGTDGKQYPQSFTIPHEGAAESNDSSEEVTEGTRDPETSTNGEQPTSETNNNPTTTSESTDPAASESSITGSENAETPTEATPQPAA